VLQERKLSKDAVMAVIRRAGFTPEMIEELATQLPDPVDLDRDSNLLARYGVTRTHLSDRLGGSP
jgi:hypothetical protein